MADTDNRLSLAEQLSANFDKLETNDVREPEAPAEPAGEVSDGAGVRSEDAAAQRARDEAGRFKEKDRDTLKLKPKEVKDAAPKQEREAQRQEPSPKVVAETSEAKLETQSEVIPPPPGWTGKGKVNWEKLPLPVKQELTSELAKATEASQKFKEFEPAIQHFAPALQQRFGNVAHGIGSVLNVWQNATSSPEGALAFVRDFMHQYKIDPQALGFGANPSQDDPAVNGQGLQGEVLPPVVQQRLAAIEQRFAQEEQNRQTYHQNQINSEITAFGSETDATGKLAHPYFNDVRKAMGVMMGGDQAKTLKDAYEMACWAVPAIRAELQREQQAAAKEQRSQVVNRAQRAGGSVTGHPGVARGESTVNQSARADLEKNWDRLEQRV